MTVLYLEYNGHLVTPFISGTCPGSSSLCADFLVGDPNYKLSKPQGRNSRIRNPTVRSPDIECDDKLALSTFICWAGSHER